MRMKNPSPNPPQADQGPPKSVAGVHRRRFLKGGLATAPIIASLASRPVLGAVSCTTASGSTSVNPSGNLGRFQTCNGVAPRTWTTTASWPGGYVSGVQTSGFTQKASSHGGPQPTLFHSGTTGFAGSLMGQRTMLQVLSLGDGGTNGLAKYCAAALLNALNGRTPVLSPAQVRNMWNDYVNRGYYEPTAGIRWNAAQIVTYINSTIG